MERAPRVGPSRRMLLPLLLAVGMLASCGQYVSGAVKDPRGGAASGALVVFSAYDPDTRELDVLDTAWAGHRGWYEFEVPGAGWYVVDAVELGGERGAKDAVVERLEAGERVVDLDSARYVFSAVETGAVLGSFDNLLDLVLVPASPESARVTGRVDGRLAPGSSLALVYSWIGPDASGQVHTVPRSDGTFDLGLVPRGNGTVQLMELFGHQVDVEVAGDALDLLVEVPASQRVRVVSDSDGPSPGLRRVVEGRMTVGFSSSLPEFELLLAEGEYRLVEHGSLDEVIEEFTVPDGDSPRTIRVTR